MIGRIRDAVASLFAARDTSVFHFRDGTRKRSVDPVAVERTLVAMLGDEWYREVGKLSDASPVGMMGVQEEEFRQRQEKRRADVLAAIDAAFGVHAYRDGAGMTEAKRFALLDGFVRFCLDLMALAGPFAKPQSRASPSPAG